MEFWTALGIEQTKDKDAITAAYHEKLKLVNPEDKPEEFKQLRAEYEAALKFADTPEEGEETDKPKTPIDLWIDRVAAVYDDFSRRRNLDEWKKLLADEVCEGLDSRIDARNALLTYIEEHYYLPREVFQLLDSTFSLIEDKEALYEIFPRDFIDYAIIDNITSDFYIPYEMYPEDTTCDIDPFVHTYFKATRELRGGEIDAAKATFADLQKTGVSHPFVDFLSGRILLAEEKYDEILPIAQPLVEKYPENSEFHMLRGEALRHTGRFEEALVDYEFPLKENEEHVPALYGKALCLTELGRLEDAKDVYYDISTAAPDDRGVSDRLKELNTKLIEQYSEREKTETFDYETAYKYAWCCYQMNDYDKALSLLKSLTPEGGIQKCDYENLYCKLSLSMEKPELSLERAIEWEKAIRALDPADESKEAKEQRDRLWRSIHIQSHALLCLDRYDEALEAAERSVAVDPTKTDALETMRRIYVAKKDREKALEVAEKVTQIKPSFMAWWVLAWAQYEAGQKQASFNSYGEAIEHDRNAAAYLQRARILCDYDQYDDAEEITKLLKENGIEDDGVKYIDARIAEGRGDKEKALAVYRDIIERYENRAEDDSDVGTAMMWETYYLCAILSQNELDNDQLIALCDKGLAEKDDYSPLLGFKGYLLDKKGDKQAAIDCYKKQTELWPRHASAYADIGNIYFDDLDDYDKAAEYYEKQLAVGESARLHSFCGLAYQYLFDFEKAGAHYDRGLEIEPNDINTLFRKALLCEYQYDYEGSYEILKGIVDRDDAEPSSQNARRNLARVLARMGRYDEAIELKLRNLSLFNDNSDASGVVELCIESGQADRAEGFINQFRKQERINEDQYYSMMRDVYLLRRDYKKYVKMLEDMPDDKFSGKYSCLATVYRRAGKFKKALECYKKCSELRGDENELANCRLYTYKWMGDKEGLEAATNLIQTNVDRLEKQRWQYSLYLTKMALIRTATDRPDEALPYIEKAMKGPMCNHCRYSKCKDAYVALVEYYCAKGEYDKAIETCREGIKIAPDEYDFVAIPQLIRKHHKSELSKEFKKENEQGI